ncbi:helix-turn-helix domain-containing protein [Pseudomonas aeruginosa]|uniref:MerR family transcriptional regulator n=1 Tax=Pseudomonas aeruginosa TaxID=287 RepID=UPI00106CAA5F|nr:helix-turn-helix domain-containing protein [Pseudomonas aeruginosa]MBA5116994.1 helix-turn-helix domain-containing protein [Pseudomonas aeruginosa]MCO3670581.1 MerR family transcriptional regulator [Pseudomonas aeruginosa]HBO9019076.1 helix-turn-helix domain-containing protein [Pseudomonas aeruginosa]HEH9487709.1 helix-turn-helix domain-containing protein [Pseudomonas aeruginosa]HEP8074123.1 helix-turn-helix domain-containing protein [Pseudomonas aeruginosa]
MWGIGALSKQTQCNIETIRYYEKIGLLHTATRSNGGHRVYNESHRDRLLFIRQGRELGFSLDDVRELISLSGDRQRSCGEALTIVRRHLDTVEAKLHRLQVIQSALIEMAESCQTCCPDARAPDCTIVETLADPFGVSTGKSLSRGIGEGVKAPIPAPLIWEPGN